VLTLKPGWNFLGVPPLHDGTSVQTSHPWNYFSLQAEDTSPITGTAVVDALGTVGSGDVATTRPWLWNGTSYGQVDTLASGVGYWFKNNRTTEVRLVRGSAPVPAPRAGLFSANNQGQGPQALIDRGQPPAPPGVGGGGPFADAALEPDVAAGCGLGAGAAALGVLLLMLFARLPLRGGRR
jgi:hypothetical protein